MKFHETFTEYLYNYGVVMLMFFFFFFLFFFFFGGGGGRGGVNSYRGVVVL